ncbi:MAG: hypothetical protein K8R68_04295 [Bacteroidales bacterium]|nr:hypothetical protein [Bacteroidales bacterium]
MMFFYAKSKHKDREITKLKIFGAIYDTHIEDYRTKWHEIKETEKHPQHYQIIYYPIDLHRVANKIKTTPDIIHQVLYYYDDIYTQNKKHLFTFVADTKSWSINFPLICVELGELQEKFDYEQNLRNSAKTSAIAAWIAIVAAILAMIISILNKGGNCGM